MKVGLDAHTLRYLNLDLRGLVQQTLSHGLEGIQLGAQTLLSCPEAERTQFLQDLRKTGIRERRHPAGRPTGMSALPGMIRLA